MPNSFLRLLAPFVCLGCHKPTWKTPLCFSPCSPKFLLPARGLCHRCGGNECSPFQCLRPWARLEGVEQIFAAFWLLEPTYTLLKKWKTTRSFALDKIVFKEAKPSFRDVRPDSTLCPIPRSAGRVKELGGCPSLALAQEILRSERRVARFKIKNLLISPAGQKRQAEKTLSERQERPPIFKLNANESFVPNHVTLVDDFFTTGATLRSAAKTLHSVGVRQVDVFCLGIRPRRAPLSKTILLSGSGFKNTAI